MTSPHSPFSRLFGLARPAWLALGLTVFCGAAGAVLTVLQAWLASQVIARVFLQKQGLAEVLPLLLPMLAAIFLRALTAGGSEISAPRMAARVKSSLRDAVYAHLVHLGPSYTRGERTGEIIAALQEGVEALEGYYSQYLPQLGLAALVPLAILFAIFPLDLLSGLILLVTAPLIPLFMILIGNLAGGLTRRQWASLGRLSAHFLDTLQGLTTLKQFGRSRDQGRSLARSGERYRQVTLEVLRVSFLSALALELIATLSTAVLAVEIGLRLLRGGMGYEQALFILILAPEFYLPLRALGQRFHAGAAGLSAARRLFAILDQPEPAAVGPTPYSIQPNGSSGSSKDGCSSIQVGRDVRPTLWTGLPIAFEKVSYSYPDSQQAAVEQVSFIIQPGQKVALVGATGSGKSTLAQLLLGFLHPTAGRITAGGRPLEAMALSAWREQVAWVPQQPYLFHETIAANLRIARANASQDALQAAARSACLDEWIASLPEGYQTSIGEGAARLSSGQAQRLALARAFLKDAPFLILDEPTAALDPQLEAGLEAATHQLTAGRTVLTIAHRLSTIAGADLILVLQSGRVIESGTHAELLAGNGTYAGLVGASIRGQA